ncbi:MAG: hypothetical protein GWN73_19280, partial [Actinobacteria bacterium]|nr:hypothetical protein [Actinomycetota bacterium]NIU67443.1 hypothetical protein [Actinomycetota bacterium]NIW29217.1 hypothetical protein [Actinomycetota bacterium]
MDFTPPCDPPQGGWSFEHGPGTSNEALEAAMAYVSAQPGRAGAWVYNLDPTPSEFQPAEVVIVAAFSGEVARHEAAIGELWSGPLCVFERSVSEPELRAIQDEL